MIPEVDHISDEYKKLAACIIDCGKNAPRLPYHNFEHAMDVMQSLSAYISDERISWKDAFLLKTAAILHDRVYVPGKAGENEMNSADYARHFLPTIGYSTEDTEVIANLIAVTDLKKEPRNLLEKIIRDADTDMIGTEEFRRTHDLLYKETKRYVNALLTRHEWYKATLLFMEKHKYYTSTALRLRQRVKEANMLWLGKQIRRLS